MDVENLPFKQGLSRAREAYTVMPDGTSLKEFLTAYGRKFTSIYAMATDMGLSHGSIKHVLDGTIDDSPTLRKALAIPKHPKRWRWIAGVDEELHREMVAFCLEYGFTHGELTRYSFNVYKDVLRQLIEGSPINPR